MSARPSACRLHVWMDVQCRRFHSVGLSWALCKLGRTRKTFLTGQRANIPFPVIRGDGIGGAWRGRGVWGLRMGGMLFRRLSQLWLCPRLSPSPPILSSSVFILLEKLAESSWRVVAMWGSSFYPLLPLDPPALSITSEVSPPAEGPPSSPPRSCKSSSLVMVSHRAPQCRPIPGELLRMEVIYWWPPCLFSLPLLLVLLSALLSYLAV